MDKVAQTVREMMGEPIQPREMICWHGAGVGDQRLLSTSIQPMLPAVEVVSLNRKLLVIAFEADRALLSLERHEPLDYPPTVIPSIYVVAEEYELTCSTRRMVLDGGQGEVEQVASSMQVTDSVDQGWPSPDVLQAAIIA